MSNSSHYGAEMFRPISVMLPRLFRRQLWSGLPLLAKILIVVNLLILVAITASGMLSYRVARDALRQEIISSGSRSVAVFAQTNTLDFLDEQQGPLNLELRLDKILQSETKKRVLSAFALNRKGQVIAAAGDRATLPHLSEATLRASDMVPRVLSQTGERTAISAAVVYDKVLLGYVLFSFDDAPVSEAGARILHQSVAITGTFLLLNFILLFMLLRVVLRPVVQLGAAAEQLTRGNYRHRIATALSDDEIGKAARSFNTLCDTIELHMRFSNAALVDRIRTGGAVDDVREHQLSIVFGDAVGYTRWSHQHSPTDIFGTLTRYYTCMGRLLVSKFQGIIDKFMGDGILAHFGLLTNSTPAEGQPIAHVQNALRAVIYAQVVLRVLSQTIRVFEQRDPLVYRFSIASGRCLVGAMGAQEIMLDYSLIGDVVNLAARLEAIAKPGGLVIDRFTFLDSGEGFLDVVDSGSQHIKGVDTPIQVYSVRGLKSRPEIEAMRNYLVEEFFDDAVIESLLCVSRSEQDKRTTLREIIAREIEQNPHLPTP